MRWVNWGASYGANGADGARYGADGAATRVCFFVSLKPQQRLAGPHMIQSPIQEKLCYEEEGTYHN